MIEHAHPSDEREPAQWREDTALAFDIAADYWTQRALIDHPIRHLTRAYDYRRLAKCLRTPA